MNNLHQKYTNILTFNTLDSTNNYLLEHIKEIPSGTIIIADEQTAGRGRHERTWTSPVGGIYFSILWHFPVQPEAVEELSIDVANAIIQGLNKSGIHEDLTVKAPNDVLHENKKLAGILIESKTSQDKIFTVIGIGINADTPDDSHFDYPATSLSQILNGDIDRNKVIVDVLNSLSSIL